MPIGPRINAALWKLLYPRWKSPPPNPTPGYTLILMVPGDLPVFLQIAIAICRTQNPDHMVEALLIPDKSPPGLDQIFEKSRAGFPAPIRMLKLNPFEQYITRRVNNPHTNIWLQLMRGINNCRTTHALWHDADLFLGQKDFLKTHYEMCVNKNLACLGVSKVWDTWYEENGIPHLTATWELLFELDWFRGFKPWQQRGHEADFNGKKHICDLTLWPQAHTPAARIGRHDAQSSFVHFSYVISTYRWFQHSKGPFEDDEFRLLLIRLLIDAFDDSSWKYEVPALADLQKGIADKNQRVTYTKPDTAQRYQAFRNRIQQLLENPNLTTSQIQIIANGVRQYDKSFGWNRTP